MRTLGGEVTIVRTRTGRWQVRLAQPGKLTLAAEQAFLAALSATANVRLSAAAAGASARAFYRRREQKRGFAREMRMALRQGYRRVECAAVAAAQPEALHGTGAWRGNDRPPVPPMTAAQALQLLYLHQKSARLDWDRPHRRRRRGESEATYRLRMMTMWEAEQRAKREDEALRAALAAEPETEAEPGRGRLPPLPALEQVTGWSRASGRPAHDPDRALFGGWRLGHMEAKRRAGG